MARNALHSVRQGAAEVDRPRIVIQVPIDGPAAECEQTGPVSEPWLARFLCDATLEAVFTSRKNQIVNVVNVGDSVRTVTPPQRRALIARDRTCVIPGCTTPAAWCDAHSQNGVSLGIAV
jgi:hypothetical protein